MNERTRSGDPIAQRASAPARWAAYGLFALLLMANLYRAAPAYDWDLIGYVAVAHSFTLNDAAAIHQETFQSIRREIPPNKYQALVDPSDPIRRSIANDPEILYKMLPLYSVKPLYPSLMYAIGLSGLSYVDASTLISRVAFIGTAGVIVLWLRRHLNVFLALLVAALVISFPPLLRLAQYSTPDSLSVFLYLSSFYLAVEKRNPGMALIVGVVAITARPDNVAYFLPFALALFAAFETRRLLVAAVGAAGLATYALQSIVSGSPGVTFYPRFIAQLPMAGASGDPVPLSLGTYLHVLARQYTEMLFTLDYVVVFLPLAAFGLWCRHRDWRFTDLYWALFAVNIVKIGVHLVAFPRELDRFLAGAYAAIVLGCIVTAATATAHRETGLPRADFGQRAGR